MGNKKVVLSSMKMVAATMISRILGLLREQVMAFSFGASSLTDAFLVAYRIPNLLRDLFAEGAFSAAFVPSFIKVNKKNPNEAQKFLWSLFLVLSLITLTITGLFIYFAPEIISVFAPSFQEDPKKFELTVLLTRIMSPFLFFVSIAALFMGALNSLKVFFIPSLAPAFFNIVMVLSIIFLPAWFIKIGIHPVLSLGVGVFIGGIVQAMVQFPLIIKKGFAPKAPDKVMNSEVKLVFKKLGPGLLGFAATQINLIVTTILATGTIVGAVSWLSYAFRLFQLPVGILGVSIGNSNLVHFGELWSEEKKDEAKDLLLSSIFLSFVVMTPALIVLYLLSDNLVNLIFQRGAFSLTSTVMTAKVLRWYALGLPFYGIYKILVPVFYTIDKQKIPVFVSITTVMINLIICVILTPIYGFEVLAIGTSFSIFLNCLIQFIFIKKNLGFSFRRILNLRYVKIILSAIITFSCCRFAFKFIDFFDSSFILKCLWITLQMSAVAIIFGGLVFAFGERRVIYAIIRKFTKKRI